MKEFLQDQKALLALMKKTKIPGVMQCDSCFGKNTWGPMSPLFLKTNKEKQFFLVPADPPAFRYKPALKKTASLV